MMLIIETVHAKIDHSADLENNQLQQFHLETVHTKRNGSTEPAKDPTEP